ncbi:MAG: protein translocase subunit SecF [Candidatus Cloacimonetes bacterium 4572_65]|nr:MAG: protein translocase subunit SecF [Candidatus Cloacimonetes bacterium 4572_65]
MKNFKFIYNRKITYIISTVLVVLSLVALFTKGPSWSIDFTGGQQIIVKLDPIDDTHDKLSVNAVREALDKAGLKDATIQNLSYKMSKGTEDATQTEKSALFMIKTKEDGEISGDATGLGQSDILVALKTGIKTHTIDEQATSSEVVSASIGKELKDKAWKSVIIALIFIVIYVGIRFQFNFGIAAIIALFHDVIITLGIFCILGLDVSAAIVAAILSIVGYSINDTIVVFDRIREDMRKRRSTQDLNEVFNTAINRTLSRTIITSCTTLFAAVSLYLFAGIVIKDFAFAIIIGTLIGTYSSIFVASPIVLDYFHSKHNDKSVFGRILNKK